MTKEMRVFKDGNAWAFVLPGFKDLQVSESFWIDEGSDMYHALEDVYETLTNEDMSTAKKDWEDSIYKQAEEV